MEKWIVQVEDAVKTFGETVALSHVSVSFERGRIHGLIGRNGSGKTVLLKCICGFMGLTSGTVYRDGQLVRPSQPQDVGVIIEDPGFVGSVSGFKNLKYLASIRGGLSDEELRAVLEQVGLDPESKKQVRKYSLGMRHRLGIAQAIMEKPKLLLLDEPMNGLDKQGVLEIRALLRRLKEEGATIILSSHYVEDIESLCDTVCEMENGTLTQLEWPPKQP